VNPHQFEARGGQHIATGTEMLARDVPPLPHVNGVLLNVKKLSLCVNSSFPHDRRTVTRKHRIFGREREPLGERLGHKDAVEGVLVQFG